MANNLLGEKALPESVNQRRRSIRSKLSDFRRPIRERRESLVPGPDLIGSAEAQLRKARSRVVGRESVLSRIRNIRSNGDSESADDSGSSGSNNTEEMTL